MLQNAAIADLFVRISVFLFLYENSSSTRTGNLVVIGLLPFVKNTGADPLGSKNKSILSSKAFRNSSCFSDKSMLQSSHFPSPIAKQQSALKKTSNPTNTGNKASHICF